MKPPRPRPFRAPRPAPAPAPAAPPPAPGPVARPPRPAPPEPDRLCGPVAVAAAFAHRPEAVLRLFYAASRRAEAGPFCARLARARKPYREVPPEELARIAGTAHHGGIVAVAAPRPVPPLPAPEALPAGLLPVLDEVGNPHNLGAIARSAAFFGCKALLLSGDPRQAGLSDAAWRTSEGGLEALALYRAPDLPAALRALAPRYLTVAAVARGGVAPVALPCGRPIALVLGNEEQGLAEETVAACSARVTLPGSGLVESLNVSVAAAVLMHALRDAGHAPVI
ncbi:rRNA methylase [Pseudoroseomonas rhizosphaerae]|uniref:rRNA methylase n=1 Tax=Teichococcus rhizosphaerae TaxID=1335062 RepID=A0A2C7A7Q1_9PROT|nr:RNA methyltransferase [Pseudoroseomonas rhizosphaerae]PHK93064.1 rRNA methylase [Pseudoroseomonas rhizosphaerae]